MRDKLSLTQEILKELPTLAISLHEIMPVLWKNIRGDGGMRLTTIGYDLFVKELKRNTYSIKLEVFEIDAKMMLALDRKLNHPYYIVYTKNIPIELILFDSSEAMLANLYGDLKKFLDNYN
jgi:hypothetical protein